MKKMLLSVALQQTENVLSSSLQMYYFNFRKTTFI